MSVRRSARRVNAIEIRIYAIISTRASEALIAELRAAGVSHIQISKYLSVADYLWLLPKESSPGEESQLDE